MLNVGQRHQDIILLTVNTSSLYFNNILSVRRNANGDKDHFEFARSSPGGFF